MSRATVTLDVAQPVSLGRRVGSGAAWSLVGAAASRAVALAALVVLTRLLAPGLVGRLSIIQITVALLSGTAGLGLRIAATKRIAEVRNLDPGAAGRFAGVATVVTFGAASCVTLALVAESGWIAGVVFHDESIRPLLLASAGVVAASGITETQLGVASGLEQFRVVALLQAGRGAIGSVAAIVGVLAGGLPGALVGWAIAEVLCAVTATALIGRALGRQGIQRTYRPTRTDWRIVRTLAAPSVVAHLFLQTGLLLAQRVVALMPGGYRDLALFNVGYRWSLAILFIPVAVSPILLPLLSNMHAEGDVHSVRTVFRANLWFALMFTAVAGAAAAALSPLILSLSGSFYADHRLPLVILAFATVPTAANNVLSQAALSLGAVRAWVVSDVALAVSVVALTYALAPFLHATGLALAYATGYVVTCLVLSGPVRGRMAALVEPVRPWASI